MKSIEGQLDINLYPQQKNGARVELSSSRPLHATKLFIGKTPEQVLNIIPLIFSICGIGQSRAALSAIEQNLKIKVTPELEIARDMLVLVENAKEHLFRLFIDWPKLFNLNPSNAGLPYLSQMTGEFKSALFLNAEAFTLDSKLNDDINNNIQDTNYLIDKLDQFLQQHVFNQSIETWLQIQDIPALHQWAQQGSSIAAKSINTIYDQGWAAQGLTDCGQLPMLDVHCLLKQFSDRNAEQFIAQPQWQGCCYETTSLTRQFEQPLIQALHKEFQSTLITRWVARLVELANIPQQLRDMLAEINNTTEPSVDNSVIDDTVLGLVQIEAARGRLIHRVNIENGLICNYQILAPTEWNFHPQGLAAKSLSSLIGNTKIDDMEKLAHLMINSIDPCVGYRLRIH